jgi:hypothetical protein
MAKLDPVVKMSRAGEPGGLAQGMESRLKRTGSRSNRTTKQNTLRALASAQKEVRQPRRFDQAQSVRQQAEVIPKPRQKDEARFGHWRMSFWTTSQTSTLQRKARQTGEGTRVLAGLGPCPSMGLCRHLFRLRS